MDLNVEGESERLGLLMIHATSNKIGQCRIFEQLYLPFEMAIKNFTRGTFLPSLISILLMLQTTSGIHNEH